MPRDIDERKKRQALRKLRKAAALAEQGLGPPLSDWEVQFLEEVEERIETYGSAFADPEKGGKDEPLSALQKQKLKEIDKKARGKGKYAKTDGSKERRSSFKSKSGPKRTYGRDINDDADADEEIILEPVAKPAAPPKSPKLQLVERIEDAAPTPQQQDKKAPALRVIPGGKLDT